jgi:hypothetical protein
MMVEAYPNPASDFMSVSVRMNMADNVTFRVMDLTGRVLSNETINTNGDNFNYVLNLNNYKTGIYLLSVEGNGARQVLKIVKQ